MKINVKLWIFISIISITVIIARNGSFGFNKKNIFDRIYSKKIKFEAVKDYRINKIKNITKATNNIIYDYELSNLDSLNNTCKMKFYDTKTLDEIKRFDFSLPKSNQVAFCNINNAFYIDNFNIFIYSTEEKNRKKINLKNFKAYDVVSLNEFNKKILVFGEIKSKNKYQTGFFLFDLETTNLIPIYIIEINEVSKTQQNPLIYSGKFSKSDNQIISYHCDKYSKIFFFSNIGQFQKEIITKDKSPKAELVTDKYATYYKRGSTYNTNNGLFIIKDELFVFSSRTEQTNKITVDCYSFLTKKYKFSTDFEYNNKTSTDINFVCKIQNNIILGFDDETALFKIKYDGNDN